MCTGYRLGSAGVVPSRRAVSVSCLVVALLLSGAAVTAADEGTGEVTGTVSTEGGHALADADVRLVNMSTGNEETTKSDANGSYSFESVEPGGSDSADVRVYTDYEVVRRIERSDEPFSVIQDAADNGRIIYDGVGILNSLRYGIISFFD